MTDYATDLLNAPIAPPRSAAQRKAEARQWIALFVKGDLLNTPEGETLRPYVVENLEHSLDASDTRH